jgi:hypothetical protein
LDEPAKLNVEDRYNTTIIEPILRKDSRYANNPNDSTIDYETFAASILTRWVDSNFSTGEKEKTLLKHPDTFDAAAAFDFPADMTSYDEYGSSSSADYGTQANFQ